MSEQQKKRKMSCAYKWCWSFSFWARVKTIDWETPGTKSRPPESQNTLMLWPWSLRTFMCAEAHVIPQTWSRIITCLLLSIQTQTHTHLFLSLMGCVVSVQWYSLNCVAVGKAGDTHEVIITDWLLCDDDNTQHTYFCPHIIHYIQRQKSR